MFIRTVAQGSILTARERRSIGQPLMLARKGYRIDELVRYRQRRCRHEPAMAIGVTHHRYAREARSASLHQQGESTHSFGCVLDSASRTIAARVVEWSII